MRQIARFSVPEIDVGSVVFRELMRVYPENRMERLFSYRGEYGNERTSALITILENSGFRPWDPLSGRMPDCRREFILQLDREYDDNELESASLLELNPGPHAHVFDSPRREDGLVRLLAGYLRGDLDFAFTDMSTWFVVPDRVKRVLQGSNLIGVRFRPTILLPGTHASASTQPIPWENHGAPWWELDADFTMPPLSEGMTFTDMNGKLLKERDFSNGFHRREKLFSHPELHYRRSSIMNFPPFDIARTLEPFGNRKGYDRLDCPVVVSKRFRQFCVMNGLNTGWVPVRIDPD